MRTAPKVVPEARERASPTGGAPSGRPVGRGCEGSCVALAWLPLAAIAAPVAAGQSGLRVEEPRRRRQSRGWVAIQHAGDESYDFALDSGQKRSGTQSMRIKKIGPEPRHDRAESPTPHPTRASWCDCRHGSGRTRSQRPRHRRGTRCPLCAAGRFSLTTSWRGQRVRGTTDWQRYTIELKLPPATTRLELGRCSKAPARCGSTTSRWKWSSREQLSPSRSAFVQRSTKPGFVAVSSSTRRARARPRRLRRCSAIRN